VAVNFAIKAFLWCKDPDAGKAGSDKIWGWVEVEGNLYNFWGRRPDSAETKKKLTFKLNPGRWGASDLQALTHAKQRTKGYKNIPARRDVQGGYPDIEAIYPNFVRSFQNQLMLAKLGDNIMNMGRLAHDATA
jgi:hypothetical protein